MRKWTVRELEGIEDDFMLIGELAHDDNIRGISEEDALWLSARIDTRSLNGTFGPGKCDACGIIGNQLKIFVDEYPDGFGSPPDISVTYLCFNDR